MMTRLPVATAEDHHNLFMAIDGVVGGMHGADALLLAGSIGGIRRDLARPHGRGRSRCGLHANVKKYVVSRTLTNLFGV